MLISVTEALSLSSTESSIAHYRDVQLNHQLLIIEIIHDDYLIIV
jgi:hypothetical protein